MSSNVVSLFADPVDRRRAASGTRALCSDTIHGRTAGAPCRVEMCRRGDGTFRGTRRFGHRRDMLRVQRRRVSGGRVKILPSEGALHNPPTRETTNPGTPTESPRSAAAAGPEALAQSLKVVTGEGVAALVGVTGTEGRARAESWSRPSEICRRSRRISPPERWEGDAWITGRASQVTMHWMTRLS